MSQLNLRKYFLLDSFSKILFILVIIFFIDSYSLYAQKNIAQYDFPIKTGSTEWNNFKSVDEMYKACQIPEDILLSLSTPVLLKTCIDYPVKTILLLYNTPQIGFEKWELKFNGISEFLKRPDAATVIIETYKDFNIRGHSEFKNDIDKGSYTFKLNMIEVIIAQEAIINMMNFQQQKVMLKVSLDKYKELETDKIYGFSNIESTGRIIGKLFYKLADQSTKKRVITNEVKEFLQSGLISNSEVLINLISEARKLKIND